MHLFARYFQPIKSLLNLVRKSCEVLIRRNFTENIGNPSFHSQFVNPSQSGKAHQELTAKIKCLDIGVFLTGNFGSHFPSGTPVTYQRNVLFSENANDQGHR